MLDRLNDSAVHQGLVILAGTLILIGSAFGLIESAEAGRVTFELLLLLLLIGPAVCLPALAFRSHAREKKRTNALLEQHFRHLNAVLENMAQGLCMFDGEQRLIVCNTRYASMYGLSPEMVKPGTTFREILEHRIANDTYAGEDHENYIRERLEAVSERTRSVKYQQLGDGRFIAIAHAPIAGGGWVATHEDITEQKQAEQALMESEARFRAIFDNSPFCMNLKDTEGRYLFANKRYEEWWGYGFEKVAGKSAAEIFPDKKRVEALEASERIVLETGETYENELSVVRPRDGELRDRWRIKFPVKSPDGEVMGLGTYAVDITERKEAEAELIRHRDHLQELVDNATRDIKQKAQELEVALAREKELNELQRKFISMASHEFRTPLAIIDSAAQRLTKNRAKLSNEEIDKRTTKIRQAVSRMTRLMESTLTAARLEDGKIEIEIGDCRIRDLLKDICERQEDLSESHVIRCDLGGIPETIQADTGALEQVFTNVLSNAVKYAPDAPDIRVEARKDGAYILVSVRDRGIGMDREDLPHLGERFFRAKTSEGIAGTGIGLNLVKALIELHAGGIEVESERGKGTVFTVRLPIAGPPEAKSVDEADKAVTDAA